MIRLSNMEKPDGRGRHPGGYTAIARLGPGVTKEQSGAEMVAIAQRLAAAYPQTNKETKVDPLMALRHE